MSRNETTCIPERSGNYSEALGMDGTYVLHCLVFLPSRIMFEIF
jgi:hypothetical protein